MWNPTDSGHRGVKYFCRYTTCTTIHNCLIEIEDVALMDEGAGRMLPYLQTNLLCMCVF